MMPLAPGGSLKVTNWPTRRGIFRRDREPERQHLGARVSRLFFADSRRAHALHRSGLAPSAEEAERLGGGDDEGDDDEEDDDDEEEQLPRATEADEDNVWSAVRGAGEEGVEFVKTAIPTYREELSSDAARALPGEGEHC